jgi:hypothetical protein
MNGVFARKPAPQVSSAVIKAAAATLNEFASQLADLILWLETERGELPDDAVLGYVQDAVTVEIRHRRHMCELARALASIERQAAGRAARIPIAAAPVAPSPQPAPVVRVVPPATSGGPDTEDAFYREIVSEGAPVDLRCLDGYEVVSAVILDIGARALLVETADGQELLIKRSLISIARS